MSRDAAIAWAAREADRCGGCGTIRGDWLDADGIELPTKPLEVVDVYCPGCAAAAAHRNTPCREDRPGVHPAFVPASRTPTARAVTVDR